LVEAEDINNKTANKDKK